MDWSALKHAYGSAADVPALLASLSPDPEASVWEQLWSRLCHQGTVYSASFAALPALIDIAEQWNPAERAQLIALAGCILGSEDVAHGRRDDLLGPVERVIPRLRQLCCESLAARGLPKHDFIYLLQAARSLDGDRFWGQELDHLASGEFPGTCPSCGIDLYLVIGEYGLFTTAEEWIQRPASEPGRIQPRTGVHGTAIKPHIGPLPEAGRWLRERAERAGQDEVADWIRYLFGTTVCPSCGRGFDVHDAITKG